MFTHTAFTAKIGIAILAFVFTASLFLAVSPLKVHAATSTNDYQAQIAELMKMVAKLQAQLKELGGSTEDEDQNDEQEGATTGANRSCVELSTRMYLGSNDASSNGQVGKLQRFLTETGDYTYGQITGYFGPATEKAVQSWQRRNGVVTGGLPDTTGYGVVGSMTIAAMARGCEPDSGEDTTDDTVLHYQTPKGIAENEIEEAEYFLDIAKDAIDEVKDTHDVADAEDAFDNAENRLGKAKASFKRKDYASASEYAQLAKDFAEDAREIAEELANEETSTDDTETITTLLEFSSGIENGKAVFLLEFEIEAVKDDLQIYNQGWHAMNEIIDSSTQKVARGSTVGIVDSTADEEGNYFVVKKGSSETFMYKAVFTPEVSDTYELKSFVIPYAETEQPTNFSSSPVMIKIDPTAKPTLTFTANPLTIASGEVTTITWSSTHATKCHATMKSDSDVDEFSLLVSGSDTGDLDETTTYTITCTGPGGSVSKSVTVTVTGSSQIDEATSLQVVYPNGGEKFKRGQKVTFYWNAYNIPATDGLDLSVVSSDRTQSTTFGTNVPNTGSFSWTIPNSQLEGAHRFRVHYKGNFDESDNVFEIWDPTHPVWNSSYKNDQLNMLANALIAAQGILDLLKKDN